MKVFKKFLFGSLLLSSFFANSAEDCKIVVAYEQEPPLVYSDNDKLTGLDKELVDFIAMKAGCKVEYTMTPWARTLEMIKEGTITLSTNANDTPERKEYANFIPYRNDTPNRLFVKKETLDTIQASSLKDFLDKSKLNVGIMVGYSYDDEIEALMKDPKYSSKFEKVADLSLNVSKLVNDRIEGFIMAQLLGNYFVKKNGLESKIGRYGFDFGYDSTLKTNLIISKRADPDNKITNLLAKTVKEVENTEEYKNILKKYFD